MNLVEPIRDKELIQDIKGYLKHKNRRNYILFLLGINTGMAIADLLKLKVRDVEGWHIVYKRQKTLKKRRPAQRIKLSNAVKKELREYTKDKPKDEFLFKSRNGKNKPITRAMAYVILREAAEEFGLEAIGTHSMRKTWGYFYYKNFNDVADLQGQMGHADPSYTLRYIGISQDEKDKRRSNLVL
jgi:integrase